MAALPQTMVRLYLKANALMDADILSKSDPYCIVSLITERTNGAAMPGTSDPRNQIVQPLGRTETVPNNLCPQWKTSIDVPFQFEAKQTIRVAIFDDDGKGPMGDDKLGTIEFPLSGVVCAANMSRTFPVLPRGTVTVSAVELSGKHRDTVTIRFRGQKMRKMDTFSESDCYFYLRRLLPGGQTRELYKSEVIDDEPNPVWKPLGLPMVDLTGANPDEETLEFRCWDEDMTADEPMGGFRFSFSDLMNKFNTKTSFRLLGDKIKKDGERKFYGDIFVDFVGIQHRPTFTEFLQSGGMEVSLAVSIDFTGSNGDPRTPQSLHYMNPAMPNQYLQAIMSVGDILIQYDTDKQIPVFGFGAGFNGVPSHFFNVNQQPSPFVNGVQGVIDAYGAFLPTCTLWGPTNFAPTIRGVSAGCVDHHRQTMAGGQMTYTVLLIITDGAITDMDQTIEAIVAADALPLSIVIVGVGNFDFNAMDILDGDGGFLRDFRGRVSRRDLVQFVPFRDFARQPREALAAAVLREVPCQVERYAELNNIMPRGKAIQVTASGVPEAHRAPLDESVPIPPTR